MTRVLHVVRDWVRPSETFVADVVARSRSATVAYGVGWDFPRPDVPSYDLERAAERGDRRVRIALAAIAWRRRTQVVHAHFGYWARHAEALARRTGRPWVLSLHGHDLLVEGCPVAAAATLVVVPSAFLAAAAVRAGVQEARLRVLPSGIDLDRHPFRERTATGGPVTVTFAGRYVEKKGVLDAARAMAGVPGLRCRFVGHGPLEDDLRALLRELRLDAELRDGSQPGAVQAALQETDVVLTPSRTAADGDAETLGLVNLEALASGALVVTTRSGGIPEAVPDDVARLVPEGDVPALRAALLSVTGAPQTWGALGRAGRAHVEQHFSLPRQVARLEDLWTSLAERSS